jgi:hypothetical protein
VVVASTQRSHRYISEAAEGKLIPCSVEICDKAFRQKTGYLLQRRHGLYSFGCITPIAESILGIDMCAM